MTASVARMDNDWGEVRHLLAPGAHGNAAFDRIMHISPWLI